MVSASPNPFEPVAYKVRDAARLMSVSESHAWKMIRLGEIRAKRLLGRTLVPKSEIDRVLAVDPDPQPIAA
ncbi:MAG: helix-turn-helix domain-containing protein [Thermomicrobiales bacterium]